MPTSPQRSIPDRRELWEKASELLTGLLTLAGAVLGAFLGFTESSTGILTLGAAIAGGVVGALLGRIIHHAIRVVLKYKGWIYPLIVFLVVAGRCMQRMDQPDVQPTARSASDLVNWSR